MNLPRILSENQLDSVICDKGDYSKFLSSVKNRKKTGPSVVRENRTTYSSALVVFIYTTTQFSGEAQKTAEMDTPTWFPFDTIPYDNMVPADRDFLPKILRGEIFTAHVRFNEDMSAFTELEYTVADKNSLET
jgi:hypothetical protein